MKDSGANAFLLGYNAQIAVDGEAQVIPAASVANRVNDKDQLVPPLGGHVTRDNNRPLPANAARNKAARNAGIVEPIFGQIKEVRG